MNTAVCTLAVALTLSAWVAPVSAARRLEPVTGNTADFGLPQMMVVRVDTPPILDGRADDAVWRDTQEGSLVHAISGGRAPVQTTFRMAWDATHLYVFVRAVERGQESFAIGPAGAQDGAVHDGDAAELFLQPGGPGAPYFQVAANPWGGHIDYQWSQPGTTVDWEAAGLRLTGHVDFDFWTLEMAIPFAALGVQAPAVGDEWRGNLCRNELPGRLLYGAWSSTGGTFQVPERFGRLQFTGPEGAAAAGHVVRGRLLQADGAAAVDIPVRAFGRVARTDSSGVYAFEGVMAGPQVLSVISPAHEAFHGRVEVDAPVVDIDPLTLRPVDPYRPRWQLPTPAQGRWLASSLEEPPDMDTAPAITQPLARLEMWTAKGQVMSSAAAWIAGADVAQPGARVTALRGPAGAVSPGDIEVRWTQRLLKRLHYQTTRDHSEMVWRFLWPEPPARIETGQLRQLVVTVTAPAQTGTYTGELEILDGDRVVTQLPVSLRVGSFELETPLTKRVGSYFQASERNGFDDAWVEVMLRDIRAHGGVHVKVGTQLGIVERDGRLVPDGTPVRKSVLLQQRLGFEPPYTVGTAAESLVRRLGIPSAQHAPDADSLRASETYRETYTRFVQAAQDLEAELGVGRFTLFWSDEIFGPGRLEPWLVTAQLTREVTDQPIYITHHSGDREKIARIDPFVDIRCYHGRKLDEDYTSAAAYDELAAELEAAGDQAWAYYNVVRTDITPEFTRLVNGYWLWRTPISVHVPWTYYYGDREALAGVRQGTKEAPFFAFAAPHPKRAEMVSSLDWECFREGWNDLRFLTTLEQAVASAPAKRTEMTRRGRALLAAWWAQDPRATSQAEALSPMDYTARRREMFELIEALR